MRFAVDMFAPFAAHDDAMAVAAVAVWGVAVVTVVGTLLMAKRWVGALLVAVAVAVPTAVSAWWVDERGGAAPTAAGSFVVLALVVAGARVEHGWSGGRVVVTAITALVALSWTCTMLAHSDGVVWRVLAALLLGTAAAAVAPVVATERSQRRFADI
jgi:hypothetical protein